MCLISHHMHRFCSHSNERSYSWHVYQGAGRRQWHPTPVLLPGKSHGWRSLVGCSPWGHLLHFHFSLSCIVESNGNPLQCSCLENRRDRGACWAAVYGVAQSRTRLKWLRSGSYHFTYSVRNSELYPCISLFVPLCLYHILYAMKSIIHCYSF